VIIVVPTSIIYGFFPEAQLELFPETIDELNFFKAIMGVYLAFAFIWVLGILKTTFLKTALISNAAFMLGLGLGRLLSIGLDGIPTSAYAIGTMGELFLGIYSLWVLSRLKV
jgi:hypothetical protein